MADNCIAFDFRENEMHVEILGWRIHFAPAMRRRPKIAFWWVLHFRYILDHDRYGRKKIFQICHIFQQHRETLQCISAIVLTCILTKYPRTVFLFIAVKIANIRTKMRRTQMFIYSLIYCLYSKSDNIAFAEAKRVFFFYLKTYVDTTLRGILFFAA